MSSERLDVVIFGASGYTGKYTVYEGVKVLDGLKWGVAGRSKEKLESTLADMGKKADKDLSKIPIIIADVNDENSLLEMAKQAKVIVNCCGPYRHFGEQVVKACIEGGASHVDVSGEPQFIETMQLKYNDQAREKGVYIVSACGFDSIPADLGFVYLEDKFDGTVNSIETYLRVVMKNKYKPKGARINHGTWESAIMLIGHANEMGKIRRQLFSTPLPRFKPEMKNRFPIHKSDIIGGHWCVPFLGTDRPVMLRSQRHFFEQDKKRPVQIRAYLAVGSFLQSIGLGIGAAIFGVLAFFSLTRKLMIAHPKFFSLGNASFDGPEEATNENSLFKMTFYGEGWKEKEADDKAPINKRIVTRVSAENPGYGATCIALLISATTILKESNKMPGNGGVLSPGAAFKRTSMISELQKNGFTFEVIKVDED